MSNEVVNFTLGFVATSIATLTVATVGGVLLSSILIPTAMLVGAVGAPIFAIKALKHKIALNSLEKKEHKYTAEENILKYEEESKMRKSMAKMKSFAVCIIPLGFITQIFNPVTSKKAVQLDDEIRKLKANK